MLHVLGVGELQGVDADDAGLAAGRDDGSDGRGRDDVVLGFCFYLRNRRREIAREKEERRV
jgi:hypothetical protein